MEGGSRMYVANGRLFVLNENLVGIDQGLMFNPRSVLGFCDVSLNPNYELKNTKF